MLPTSKPPKTPPWSSKLVLPQKSFSASSYECMRTKIAGYIWPPAITTSCSVLFKILVVNFDGIVRDLVPVDSLGLCEAPSHLPG